VSVGVKSLHAKDAKKGRKGREENLEARRLKFPLSQRNSLRVSVGVKSLHAKDAKKGRKGREENLERGD